MSRTISDESSKEQQGKASAYMVIRFRMDRGEQSKREYFSVWSDEWKRSDITTIHRAIGRLKRLFAKYWQANAISAAIFDMRQHEKPGNYNKVWQYEDGDWTELMKVF